jgi:TPR repeat protein
MFMRMCRRAILAILPVLLASTSWSADFDKGQDAYSSGDYETAIAEWQGLAEEGHAGAQFGMGLLYANGFGVTMDDFASLKWYGLAAEQKHPEAQANLGVMYANGWGVRQSDEEAFNWYTLAAEQGIVAAQVGIAKMYSNGFGAEKNIVLAHKWFSIASELGDYNAASKRDDLAAKMSEAQIADAAGQATTWLENNRTLQANQ